MDLVILRHGEAGKRLGMTSEDSGRALTVAGRQEVAEVARAMKAMGLEFDIIATSPLKRARETAEIAARILGLEKNLKIWDELKPEEDTRAFYRRISKLRSDSSLLLVGHEPYLSNAMGEMMTGGREARISLKKAGLAKLEITAMTATPTAELKWLLTPRLAKKVS
jgi:phosphohistidine phosphatase